MVLLRPYRAESKTRTCLLIHAISSIVLKHPYFTTGDVITAVLVVMTTAAAATIHHREIGLKYSQMKAVFELSGVGVEPPCSSLLNPPNSLKP